MKTNIKWRDVVREMIRRMPTDQFTLQGLYRQQEHVQWVIDIVFENGANIEARVQDTLQRLRDLGEITFVNNDGLYRKRAVCLACGQDIREGKHGKETESSSA